MCVCGGGGGGDVERGNISKSKPNSKRNIVSSGHSLYFISNNTKKIICW